MDIESTLESIWEEEENSSNEQKLVAILLHFSEAKEIDNAKQEWNTCGVILGELDQLNDICICSSINATCEHCIYIKNKFTNVKLGISPACYEKHFGNLEREDNTSRPARWAWLNDR